MDYIDYIIIKAIVLVIAAFIWGLYCGAKGLPLDPSEWEENAKR